MKVDEPRDVIEWHPVQRHVSIGEAIELPGTSGPAQQVPMGEHHCFGSAGAARGQHQDREVVGPTLMKLTGPVDT